MKCEIVKLDNFGRGITYFNDKICFINGALPGDIISFNIVVEKNKYIEGNIDEIYSYSKDRIHSMCPYFHECGGCVFQEYEYSLENKFKEEKVKFLVSSQLNMDDIVSEIVFDEPLYYRNKITLHGNNNKVGLYKYNSNDIVKIDNCVLCNKKINRIINILNNYSDLDEVMIRTSNDLSSILLNIKGNITKYDDLLKICDVLIINSKVITKKTSIVTTIGNKKYLLSSNSFFQVNLKLIEKMFDKVLDLIKIIKPNTMLDLYCGTGTFGIYVSSYVSKIVGIDYNKSNINDAVENAKLNNVSNIQFICDKVENVIDKYKNVDLILVDPPRSGLDKKTIENLNRIESKNIIYVSCNPNTLVRDLKLLSNIYNIIEIVPFNMFPRTYHCESVCILERR